MPSKRDETVADLTVKILREIRDEAKQTNVRLDQTNARLDGLQHEMHESIGQTNARLDGLQREMRAGFEHVGRRIDNLLLGPHRDDHEQIHERLDRIEHHIGLTGP